MFDPSKLDMSSENKKSEEKKDIKIDVLGAIENKKIDNKSDEAKIKMKKSEKSSEEITNKKTFLLDNKVDKKVKKIKKDKKIIFDVNLIDFNKVFELLSDKEKKYDFVTFEPDDQKVKVDFRKDGKIVEIKYVKYQVYLTILLKVKSITKLNLEETKKIQEGKGIITSQSINYDIISKVVPSDFGENLFLKARESQNKEKQLKQKKKKNLTSIFTFLLATLVIFLIIGGGFLAFVVLNAKTVNDVRFFTNLGINLNEINDFIKKIVFVIFSLLIFVEVVFLVISLFKFLLTKKIFKKKKVKYGIISMLLFILTFGTATGWLYIDRKVNSLPRWDLLSLGEIQPYDNAKLKSKYFDQKGAFISDTKNLIGPIEIMFNLEVLEQNELKSGKTIQEYNWTFTHEGKTKEIVEKNPNLIYKFDKEGITNVELNITETDSANEVYTKKIKAIDTINITKLVDVTEIPQETGGKLVKFDASKLSSQGVAEWYSLLDNGKTKLIHEGFVYVTGEPIFKETLLGLYLKKEGKKSEKLDKIFVIEGENNKKLNADIKVHASPIDDLKYTFEAENIKLDYGAGIIDKFIWKIGDKEFEKTGVYGKEEESSKINYTFKNYGEEEIKLTIIDSAGNKKNIIKKIEVKKKMRLSKGLEIYADGKKLKNFTYKPSLGEYSIQDIGVPTVLEFDARGIIAENSLYALESISWDLNGDGNIDKKGRQVKYQLVKVGSNTIKIIYTLKNRKVKSDKINVIEYIYIDSIKKDAIIRFRIIKDSEYVPVKVGFDASNSIVKNKNISKFIWDFGDGIREERDAVVPGHIYTKKGNYVVKLTLITDDGKIYSTEKNLILKPTAQTVKIKTSLKEAPVYQEIDFLSSGSSGSISGYYWDFGDGEFSTKANPSHFYKKPGNYKVKLTLNFTNNNIMDESINIKIY